MSLAGRAGDPPTAHSAPTPDGGRAVPALVRAVLAHPELWPAAVGALFRLARPRWWRHFPPMPMPSDELWRFRMTTAYGGSGDSVPERDDVVSFLRWSRDMRRWRRV